MRFPRRLVTPVLAAVMLVGGAAYAQEVVDDVVAGDVLEIGPITWSYDPTEQAFVWGSPECIDDADSSTEVAESLVTDVVDDGAVHTDDNCYSVPLGNPEDPEDPKYTAEGIPNDGHEGNHGQFVSGFGEKLREIDKDELEGNRGSFMRVIAKLNPFKNDKGDDDSETTIEEADEDLDEDSGKPDKAPKEPKVDNPNKANGRQDK